MCVCKFMITITIIIILLISHDCAIINKNFQLRITIFYNIDRTLRAL